jgi:serine/threonine protein kinase
MTHVTYPPGDTTASRIKALVLWIRRERDRDAATLLVREIGIDAEYFDDETRPIPVATWHKALLAFADRYGRDAIRNTWTGVIDQENLGVWTRVLRGTHGPEGALAQLEMLGGEELKTSRWEVIDVRPGQWHGRVTVSHDPSLERDGLCSLARAAELVGIPAMFGYGAGTVEILPSKSGTAMPTRTGKLAEEYVLRWKVPDARRGMWLALGCAAASSPVFLASSGAVGSAIVVGAGVVGGAFGAAWQAGRHRRAESHAQMSRIRALERSVALKEQRERAAVGFFEGSVIAGKYRLGPKLGAGASGVIHQATRLADNAPVAIKLLRAAVAHDTVASDRLRREAEALGLTWHPNVVEVFDHDHLPDGTAYLVMEQLEGESLATRLRTAGSLASAEIASIVSQVCDALGAVHAAGVIHRDVKPSNIFLARSAEAGAPPQVKLLDFGIAKVEWAETRLTNMGAPLGTPGYMSPEQEQGGDIDARSDLYAVGAVIYECFAGVPPPASVSGSFEIAPPSAPTSGRHAPNARIPPEWRTIIHQAMAPLPAARYRDARAMREAITELIHAGSSVETPTASDRGGTRSATDVKKTNVSK